MDPSRSVDTKVCRKCKEEFPADLDHFYKSKILKDGLYSYCKWCVRDRERTREEKNPGKKWRREYKAQLIYKYGITVDEYEAMCTSQNNACAICTKEFKTNPCVDHCHKSGKARKLLCKKCNSALGLFGDSEDTLLRAAAYLAAHRED